MNEPKPDVSSLDGATGRLSVEPIAGDSTGVMTEACGRSKHREQPITRWLLGQVLLKGPLNDLFQIGGEPTTEQFPQDRNIARRMENSRIDDHLNPEPDPIDFYAVSVRGPFDAAHHRAELRGQLIDGVFKCPASVF